MLSLGLTGGIASGKSLVSNHLRELGATVIDADQLAREVVEPGSLGLEEIVAAFGTTILDATGKLDRPALAAIVFKDPSLLAALNQIIHPKVRKRANELEDAAPNNGVVVHDIPLLVETGQSADFNLVLVVQASKDARVERMVQNRGMSVHEANSRITAQASDEQRRDAADVVLKNCGTQQEILAAVDELWATRLLPFARNLASDQPALRSGSAIMVEWQPRWEAQAKLLGDRVLRAAGELAVGVDHIGSTAVPGLAAKDVIDLQLRVNSMDHADAVAGALASVGFPKVTGILHDNPHSVDGEVDPMEWEKRLHSTCDPGQPVNLHVRVDGSLGAQFASTFRDWLRANHTERMDYEVHKRRLASQLGDAESTESYAQAKEGYFGGAYPSVKEWLAGEKQC